MHQWTSIKEVSETGIKPGIVLDINLEYILVPTNINRNRNSSNQTHNPSARLHASKMLIQLSLKQV